jgi:methionyl-tRNA formyltransferase
MLIQILVDNNSSWILPFTKQLVEELSQKHFNIVHRYTQESVTSGEILIMLSCEKLFKNLHLNKKNLVVHESALPKGKGWSPLTWQVLEGETRIPVTLFEANIKVDAGNIYDISYFELDGTELIDELRIKQWNATREIIINYINNYDPDNLGVCQVGDESFYPRRTQKNSLLDINKSISEQFNLLRVCDNERYPAWFEINGTKYIIKVYKDLK